MAEENKIAELYVAIKAKSDELEADLNKLKNKYKKDSINLNFNTSMGKLKLDELLFYHTRLKKVLEQKIKLNADTESIQRTSQQIESIDSIIKKISVNVKDGGDKLSRWSQITTGINQGFELLKNTFSELKQIFGQSVLASNSLNVLRDNFEGTKEDLELFKIAVAGTVTEGDLIRLSNQASDLGISLKDQAILFSLAEDAADKYGTTTIEGFQKIVTATEGSAKGLKSLGIQKAVYDSIVDSLAKSYGDELKNLDAETQKQIRLQAILNASGVTLEDVKNKVKDNADKYESLSVRVDEAKIRIGELVSKSLLPTINAFDSSGKSAKDFMSALIAVTGVAIQLAPLLIQLKTTTALIGTTSAVASLGIDKTTASLTALQTTSSGTLSILTRVASVLSGLAAAGFVVYTFSTKPEDTITAKMIEDATSTPIADFERRQNNSGFNIAGKDASELKKQMSELNSEMKLYEKGSLVRNTIQSEYNNILLAYNKIIKENKKSGGSPTTSTDSNEKFIPKIPSGYNADQVAMFEDLKFALDGYIEYAKAVIDEKYKNDIDSAKGNKDAILKAEEDKVIALAKLNYDRTKYDQEQNIKRNEDAKKYLDEQTEIEKNNQEKIQKQNEEYLNRKTDAYNKYADAVGLTSDSVLQTEFENLQKAALEIETVLGDKLKAEQFYYEERKKLEEEYYLQKWEKLAEDNELFNLYNESLKSGWQTALHLITNEQMTGAEKWKEIGNSMLRTGIDVAGELLTNWISTMIAQQVFGNTFRAAEVAAASVTGASIASAYAPAAAFASTMTFGGAALAGGTALASTVALAEMLAIPKFAKGGEFTVPNGYPNDSFLMAVTSGEHVNVTPSHKSSNSSDDNEKLLNAVLALTKTLQNKNFSPNIINTFDAKSLVKNVTKPAENKLVKAGVNVNGL